MLQFPDISSRGRFGKDKRGKEQSEAWIKCLRQTREFLFTTKLNVSRGCSRLIKCTFHKNSKLTRQDAAQKIWELVTNQLAYSWMENVVQYKSPYSVAKTYRSVCLFRNTRKSPVHKEIEYCPYICATSCINH